MTQPIIPWIGGKRRLAPLILPLFPEHTCYVELFSGAAANDRPKLLRAYRPSNWSGPNYGGYGKTVMNALDVDQGSNQYRTGRRLGRCE